MSQALTTQPQVESPPDIERRRKGMLFLGLAVASVGFAMMLQMGLNDNFLVQEMGLDPGHKGLLEAIRESCGIAAVGILALIVGLKEPIIATAMLALVGVGVGAYYGVHDFFWLAFWSVVWSQGLHIWMPLPNSMVLAIAEPGNAGRRLGQLQAFAAVGSALALAVALAPSALRWLGRQNLPGLSALGLENMHLPLRPMYLAAGAAAVLGALFCIGIPRDIKAPGLPLVFRRKYWLYYLLCFLEGWRKQIFLAFAGYLLVRVYHMPVHVMLLLWTAIQVLCWLSAGRVGRLIDRLGERKILMLYYAAVTAVFCGYAMVKNVGVLAGLFVIDNTFSLLAMSLTTYVRRMAPVTEHTATLSMGVAFNHVGAVMMPLLGGWLWMTYGYQAAFQAGAVAAVGSIFVAMMLPRRDRDQGTGNRQ